MIDFNINIAGEGLFISQAMIYAKRAGLKAFALTFPCYNLPTFLKDQEILQEISEADFQNILKNQDNLKDFQEKHFHLDNPLFQAIQNTKEQIHTLGIYNDVQSYFAIKLMHIPPALLANATMQCRLAGISLIGVYGQTISDIVEEGTNFAAINAKADILYCSGLIDEKAVELAKENDVYLEISTHKNHAYCNAHIAKMAQKYQAKMVLGSDANRLDEIHTPDMQQLICKGAGIDINSLQGHDLYQKLQKQ